MVISGAISIFGSSPFSIFLCLPMCNGFIFYNTGNDVFIQMSQKCKTSVKKRIKKKKKKKKRRRKEEQEEKCRITFFRGFASL